MSPTASDHSKPARTAPRPHSPSLDRWEDEGGPVGPKKTSPPAAPAPSFKNVRDQRDTASGCRERAAADLLEAASLATLNGRLRMESSAAMWTQRAELLGRLEASFDARQAAVRESVAGDEEAPLRT